MTQRPFHRPVPLADLDSVGASDDPVARSETSHATAALLLGDADGNRDEEATRRFIELADDIGFEIIAEMWSAAPAVSAPGALWRLYALRQWIKSAPRELSEMFADGQRAAGGIGYDEVLAGVELPAGPDEVARAIDEILAGANDEDASARLRRLSQDLSDAGSAHRRGGLD